MPNEAKHQSTSQSVYVNQKLDLSDIKPININPVPLDKQLKEKMNLAQFKFGPTQRQESKDAKHEPP